MLSPGLLHQLTQWSPVRSAALGLGFVSPNINQYNAPCFHYENIAALILVINFFGLPFLLSCSQRRCQRPYSAFSQHLSNHEVQLTQVKLRSLCLNTNLCFPHRSHNRWSSHVFYSLSLSFEHLFGTDPNCRVTSLDFTVIKRDDNRIQVATRSRSTKTSSFPWSIYLN